MNNYSMALVRVNLMEGVKMTESKNVPIGVLLESLRTQKSFSEENVEDVLRELKKGKSVRIDAIDSTTRLILKPLHGHIDYY